MTDSFFSKVEAEQLLQSNRLDHELDVRLIQIAFGNNASAAIRAIEMLRASGAGDPDDELAGITTEILLEARAALHRRLREMEAGNGSGNR